MRHSLISLFLFTCIFACSQDSVSIFFDFDSHSLTKNAKEKLKLVAGKSILSIYGYTDSRGDNAYNKKLAQNRINATLNYLDINSSSISMQFANGEENLISTIHAENRKVVIYFEGNSGEFSVSIKGIQQKAEKSVGEELVKAKVGEKVNLKALNFQPGLDILLPESFPTLEELLMVMKSNQKLIIQVQGHICCASADFADLSTSRAYRVYEYLLNNGIAAERLSYLGFGVSQPLYAIPEKTSTEEVSNRRVEVKIISN
jgi:outer membrane protein OmpA-like peptidoglycan-associated protein